MTSRDGRLVQEGICGSGALGEEADRLEHGDRYCIWQSVARFGIFVQSMVVYQKAYWGKTIYMQHMLVQQEWKGRSSTTRMNESESERMEAKSNNYVLVNVINKSWLELFSRTCAGGTHTVELGAGEFGQSTDEKVRPSQEL